ncbi:tudor domain-containing protein 15, partial [Latimeria chalumnae]|uniref:tudor domain-containing protein 15 n=1 Tax=Latimeria chalumnae TaxID=7897 RepID=UPI00313A9A16
MDCIPPLPKILLDMDLKILHVECHSQEALIKFWGQYTSVCELDYHILQNEIQHVTKIRDCIGTGEFCLVEETELGEWHRGRVLNKSSETYKVFLIDIGNVLTVSALHVASASGELFQLPPKIICGIFANVLPATEKWAPEAMKYFSSLTGLEVKGHVQAILPKHIVLLEVPEINYQVFELHLGRLTDGDTFHLIVEVLKEVPQMTNYELMPDLLQQKYTRPESSVKSSDLLPGFQNVLSHFMPCMPVGATKKVKITAAISFDKFYCQLLNQEQELKKMTKSITLCCESKIKKGIPMCENFGVMCAAKQKDGQWHRGVLQQLLPNGQVKVWFIDYGNSEAVSPHSIQKLEPNFVSVPIMSFLCALSCLTNQNEELRNSQMEEFKLGLLGQIMYAHVDLYSPDEHLHYVTLHNQDKIIDPTFQVTELLPTTGFSANQIAVPSGLKKTEIPRTSQTPVLVESVIENVEHRENSFYENSGVVETPYKTAAMKSDAIYVAYAEYVLNPSNFWIRTDEFNSDFEAMMKNIADIYNKTGVSEELLNKPKPGLLCCARYSRDLHYYRAVITEVFDLHVSVYFLDFGNTDTVPLCDVKNLLPQFMELPALAMHCSLAHVTPIDEVWTKNVNDFFRKTLFSKVLLVHVIARKNNTYIVDVHDMEGSGDPSIITIMIKAGYAEYWETRPKYFCSSMIKESELPKSGSTSGSCNPKLFNNLEQKLVQKHSCASKTKPQVHSQDLKDLTSAFPCLKNTFSKENLLCRVSESSPLSSYKQYTFKVGSIIDVKCSFVFSPSEFWCRLQTKSAELMSLMKQIQKYYKIHNDPYQSGQVACVARDTKDCKWYRASVVKYVPSAKKYDVMFVDYGNQERVSLKDLRSIEPKFLLLESQAFRCSLYGLIESTTGDPLNWNSDALKAFKDFVGGASAKTLTCTICAMTMMTGKGLCNVVNVTNPLESASQFLIERGLAKPMNYPKQLVPSVHLYSYYYCSFNIKVGSEEEVYITHVCSPSEFYCQLGRNAENTNALMEKIGQFVKLTQDQILEVEQLRLCLAKYFGDGQWYRAMAYPLESPFHLKVYFVDYGDTQIVEKKEVLPIPQQATEILSVPMQAIKCCLSDIEQREMPVEVTKWFEENLLGKLLKAIVVSREENGKLFVDLYDGEIHINEKIKELHHLYIKRHMEPLVFYENDEKDECRKVQKSWKIDWKLKGLCLTKSKVQNEVAENGDTAACNTVVQEDTECDQELKKIEMHTLPLELNNSQCCEMLVSVNTVLSSSGPVGDGKILKEVSDCKVIPSVLEPTQNTLGRNCLKLNENKKEVEEVSDLVIIPTELEPTLYSTLQSKGNGNCGIMTYEIYRQNGSSSLPKLIDLPQPCVQPDFICTGYISCIHDPSRFFIQLEKDIKVILDLAIEMNEGINKECGGNPYSKLMIGDLVAAEFTEDGALYRAAITEICPEGTYKVEFIDYGNTETVDYLNVYRLQEKFLEKPRLSIPSQLSKVQSIEMEELWTDEDTAFFEEIVKEKLVTCEFLKLSGNRWEVCITSDEKSVLHELTRRRLLSPVNTQPTKLPVCFPVLNPNILKDVIDLHLTAEKETLVQTDTKIPSLELNTGQMEVVSLLNIIESGEFYVKVLRSSEKQSDLILDIDKEAEKSDFLLTEKLQEGMECLAQSAKNLRWYRAEIKRLLSNEKQLLVLFVDNGITEVVSFSNVKKLNSDIRDIHREAVLCRWVENSSTKELSNEINTNMLFDQEVKIIFLRHLECNQAWEVEFINRESPSSTLPAPPSDKENSLLQDAKKTSSTMSKKERLLFTEVASSNSNSDSEAMAGHFMLDNLTGTELTLSSALWTPVHSGKEYFGFATAVIDPSEFYIQLEDSLEIMKTLFVLLVELPTDMSCLPEAAVTLGTQCLVRCILEEQWCRAEILEVTNDFVLLKFIDFGYHAFFPLSDTKNLKELPEQLSKLPRLAYPCVLKGVMPANQEQWTDEAVVYFQECLNQQGLVVQFKQYISEDAWEVDISIQGENLADKLLAAGYAFDCESSLGFKNFLEHSSTLDEDSLVTLNNDAPLSHLDLQHDFLVQAIEGLTCRIQDIENSSMYCESFE